MILEEVPLLSLQLHGWPVKWARTTCIARLSQRLERWVLQGSMNKIWKETCTGGPEVFTEYIWSPTKSSFHWRWFVWKFVWGKICQNWFGNLFKKSDPQGPTSTKHTNIWLGGLSDYRVCWKHSMTQGRQSSGGARCDCERTTTPRSISHYSGAWHAAGVFQKVGFWSR